jgi:hypothetical protein
VDVLGSGPNTTAFGTLKPAHRRDTAFAAQTERRGGAGPVRGLLGGKDLTGRFRSNLLATHAAISAS